MGDAYIHFVYARNLSQTGELAFNPGTDEGIGTTSILWVLLLAGLNFATIPLVTAAKLLGLGLLVLEGQLVFRLAQAIVSNVTARQRILIGLAAGLLAVIPGNTVWLALSGMETMLFLTLGLLALYFYHHERLIWTGIILGLLALTRTEGLVLAIVLSGLELWRRRTILPWALKLIVPIVLLLGPWLAFLSAHEGAPLPSSFQGKQAAMLGGAVFFEAEHPEFIWLNNAPMLLHMLSWAGYIVMFMTGGADFPGPTATFGGPIDPEQFVVPFLGIVVSLSVFLSLTWVAGRSIVYNRQRFHLSSPGWRLVVALLAWNVGHNLLYAVVLPIPGAAGRYGPINQLFVWEIALAGILFIRSTPRRILGIVGITTLLSTSLVYWHNVYFENIAFMDRVRLPAARFVEQNLPPDAVIGAVDLGPLKFYGARETIDLFGFVNNSVVKFRASGGSTVDYMLEQDIEYMQVFSAAPDNEAELFNFARYTGIYDDERVKVTTLTTYSVPASEWLHGSMPVNNYLPAIEIIHVENTK